MHGRIAGLDVARALAIVGMLAVHVGPTDNGTLVRRLYALPHGRASVLFVLIAGVGVSLLARSRRASVGRTRVALLWRAALLLPLGLALQLLDHGALVILQNYAALFLLAVLVVRWSDRWLLALAATSAALGPVVYLWGSLASPETFHRSGLELADPASEIAHGLVLSGPYPLMVWAAPFLLGVWLGRRDLNSPALRMRLVFGGAATAIVALSLSWILRSLLGEPGDVVGWSHLITHTPHSQMPLWLLGAAGSAAFVLGVSLVATAEVRRLSWPLVAVGQLALTVYVGHLLALHAASDALTSEDVGRATVIVLLFTVVAAAGAVAWRSAFARGPLEALMRPPWQLLGNRLN